MASNVDPDSGKTGGDADDAPRRPEQGETLPPPPLSRLKPALALVLALALVPASLAAQAKEQAAARAAQALWEEEAARADAAVAARTTKAHEAESEARAARAEKAAVEAAAAERNLEVTMLDRDPRTLLRYPWPAASPMEKAALEKEKAAADREARAKEEEARAAATAAERAAAQALVAATRADAAAARTATAQADEAAATWALMALMAAGAAGAAVIMLRNRRSLTRSNARANTPISRIESAREKADRIFSLFEPLVPARLADEELGDALEIIDGMDPRPRIYWMIASTICWLLIHAAQEKVLAIVGVKKGG